MGVVTTRDGNNSNPLVMLAEAESTGTSTVTYSMVIILVPESEIGLPKLCLSPDDVASLSSRFGEYVTTNIETFNVGAENGDAGGSYPCATVTFFDETSIKNALESLNGTKLGNIGTLHALRVNYSLEARVRATAFYNEHHHHKISDFSSPVNNIAELSAAPLNSQQDMRVSPISPPAFTGLEKLCNNRQQQQQQMMVLNPQEKAADLLEGLHCVRFELMGMFVINEINIPAAILGDNERHVRFIREQAGNQVNVMLRGIPSNAAPSTDRLHLILESRDRQILQRATELTEDLLVALCYCLCRTCLQQGVLIPEDLGFVTHQYMKVTKQSGDAEELVYVGSTQHDRGWLQLVPQTSVLKSADSAKPSWQLQPTY